MAAYFCSQVIKTMRQYLELVLRFFILKVREVRKDHMIEVSPQWIIFCEFLCIIKVEYSRTQTVSLFSTYPEY